MFIIQNALKNLGRNKGRCILLWLLITAVLTAATVVMLMKDATKAWSEGYRDTFGVEVGLGTDWEYARDHCQTVETVLEDGSVETTSFFEAESVPMETLENFADSELVQKAELSGYVRYASDSIKPVELGENMMVLDGMSPEELCEVYGVETEKDLLQYMSEKELQEIYSYKKNTNGLIYAYSDPAYIREFREGKKKLKEGRFFENKGEAVIGDELADKNGLKPGDKITVSSGKKGEDAERELTVVGIFSDLYAEANQADVWIGFSRNDILIGYETYRELGFGGRTPFMDEIKYFVKDPDSLESFEKEVRAKGLPECYQLQYDVTEYEKIVGPVQKASAMAGTFGKIVLLAGACILMVLTVINVRDRKYEIGVLRAIGMPKWQVSFGMISEVLMIVCSSAVAGFTAGTLLIRPVIRLAVPGNEDLASSIITRPAGILPILGAALGLAMIAGLISTVYITGFEPMKIFRNAE